MSGLYSVIIENGSIANASGDYDLVEIDPAAEKKVELVEFVIAATTEVGEAQEEWLRLSVTRGHTTDGTGGSAPTPQPLDVNNTQAAGFTADILRTAIASSGTAVTPWSEAVNVRQGFRWGLRPIGTGISTTGAALLTVRMHTTVADDMNINATFVFFEH